MLGLHCIQPHQKSNYRPINWFWPQKEVIFHQKSPTISLPLLHLSCLEMLWVWQLKQWQEPSSLGCFIDLEMPILMPCWRLQFRRNAQVFDYLATFLHLSTFTKSPPTHSFSYSHLLLSPIYQSKICFSTFLTFNLILISFFPLIKTFPLAFKK